MSPADRTSDSLLPRRVQPARERFTQSALLEAQVEERRGNTAAEDVHIETAVADDNPVPFELVPHNPFGRAGCDSMTE